MPDVDVSDIKQTLEDLKKIGFAPHPTLEGVIVTQKFLDEVVAAAVEGTADVVKMVLEAGGPGSGCSGDNCGRPKGLGEYAKLHDQPTWYKAMDTPKYVNKVDFLGKGTYVVPVETDARQYGKDVRKVEINWKELNKGVIHITDKNGGSKGYYDPKKNEFNKENVFNKKVTGTWGGHNLGFLVHDRSHVDIGKETLARPHEVSNEKYVKRVYDAKRKSAIDIGNALEKLGFLSERSTYPAMDHPKGYTAYHHRDNTLTIKAPEEIHEQFDKSLAKLKDMYSAASIGIEDTGEYNEDNENRIRKQMELWVNYAESGPSFDPEGKYQCKTCTEKLEPSACHIVSGKISMDAGSCRTYEKGKQRYKGPAEHHLTQIEAQYGERPKTKAFGCARCEYGDKAKSPDSQGRPSWCTFFGVHIQPLACCAMNEGDDSINAPGEDKDVEAGGPGSGRHKGDYNIAKVDHPSQRADVTYKGEQIGYVQQVTAKTGQMRWDAFHTSGQGFRERTRQDVVESMIDHHLRTGIKAGGPGSGRHKEISDSIKDFIKKDGRSPYEINDGDCRDVALYVKQQVPEAKVIFDPIHTFIENNGKYYDAEKPEGVSKMEHLPMFKDYEIDKSLQRELKGKDLKAAALWNGIPITGFTGPEEEGLRAMLSRIPPELLIYVKGIESAKELNAKHGMFITDTGIIKFNPADFALRQRFGKGEGWIYHPELTVVHEVGHSIYENFTKEKRQEWKDLSGWVKGTKDGNSAPYKETRPGWEPYNSAWTHKLGIGFTRFYAEKNPNEDFADSFAFFILGKGAQMERSKRTFLEQYIRDNVKNYPQPLIASPEQTIKAGGPGSGRHKGPMVTLYHGVPNLARAKKIVQEGLRSDVKRDRNYKDLGDKERSNYVYLTKEDYVAHDYGTYHSKDGHYAVVTFRVPKEMVSKGAESSAHEFRVKGNLGSEYISKAEHWYKNPNTDDDDVENKPRGLIKASEQNRITKSV
jgi:uncharacterized protein YdaT